MAKRSTNNYPHDDIDALRYAQHMTDEKIAHSVEALARATARGDDLGCTFWAAVKAYEEERRGLFDVDLSLMLMNVRVQKVRPRISYDTAEKRIAVLAYWQQSGRWDMVMEGMRLSSVYRTEIKKAQKANSETPREGMKECTPMMKCYVRTQGPPLQKAQKALSKLEEAVASLERVFGDA